MVLPYGDLQQLRDDGQRHSVAFTKTFLREHFPAPFVLRRWGTFPIERDLVVSVDGFVKKLEGIHPLIPKEPRALSEGEYLRTRTERSSSTPHASTACCVTQRVRSSGLNPDFTGPGVLALLHRYNADSTARRGSWAEDGSAERRGRRLEAAPRSDIALKYVLSMLIPPMRSAEQSQQRNGLSAQSRVAPGRKIMKHGGRSAFGLRATHEGLVDAQSFFHELYGSRGHHQRLALFGQAAGGRALSVNGRGRLEFLGRDHASPDHDCD